MRTREIERKVKKALQHSDFTVEVFREDGIIRVRFHRYESKPLSKLNDLALLLGTPTACIFPDNLHFYVDFYYND